MGPIREVKRRKKCKTAEREADQNGGSDWWDDFSKRLADPSSESKHRPRFRSFLKMSRKTFNYICLLVKEKLMAKSPNLADQNGKLLSLNDRVATALRRLTSGESLTAVGELLGMNQSTVAQITKRFVEAVEESGLQHLRWPLTEIELEKIKSDFEKISGLQNCCGVIDTTHILMSLPTVDGSDKIWRDKEQNHSMIVQAIVGPDMRFLDIVTGWPGSLSDSAVLKASSFFRLVEEGKHLNGNKIRISEETELGEYIIGDSGFPLLPWLLTPYPARKLSRSQANLNERMDSTLVVAQRALTRFKDMWRVIKGVMWRPDRNRLPRIVLVCCILHNIVLDLEGDEVKDEKLVCYDHDPGYRQQVCESTDKKASRLRETLCIYVR